MQQPSEIFDCSRVGALLEPFVDGDLGSDQAHAIELHLHTCQACSNEHSLTLEIRDGLRRLPESDASALALTSIRRQLVTTGSVLHIRRPAWPRLAAAAAIIAAIAASLIVGLNQKRGPGDEEIARARAEARLALAVIATVTQEAGTEVRTNVLEDRVLRPAVAGVFRSLAKKSRADDTNNRPQPVI